MTTDPQAAADSFYSSARLLLSIYYPPTTVTITSRDPHFISPVTKTLLRKKNKAMRKGHLDKASALSIRIRQNITAACAGQLTQAASDIDVRTLWTSVGLIMGKNRTCGQLDVSTGINAEMLNQHYSNISTDSHYTPPILKTTCYQPLDSPTDYQVFQMLDKLKRTATGPDEIPYWFLRIAAPILATPLSHLYRLSLSQSFPASQWKEAVILPLPKVPHPNSCSEYRPISLTPIICRILERLLLRQYLHPLLLTHPFPLMPSLDDQYAYRPTGSTTAALISLFHKISTLLETNSHVHVITFDFSKAFDTVAHAPLINRMASVGLPDHIFNWVSNFLTGRQHKTRFSGCLSSVASISAGVVQGSAIGPAAFCICVSTYRPCKPGNQSMKYADDIYLLVP